MNTRRVLVLCYFYPPLAGGGVHRVLGFTRHLPEHGWNCTVVCAGTEDYWVTDESLIALARPETEVIRVPGGSALSAWLSARRSHRGRRPGRLFSFLRALADWGTMPDSYAGWSRRAERRAERLLAERGPRSTRPPGDRFDVVLTSSPPDSVQLAGLGLKRRVGLPWVADFRDPWVGLHLRAPRSSWHRRRHAGLERDVLGAADLVLAASATHARQIAARSERSDPAVRRLAHLPNGFEPDPAGITPRPARDGGFFTLVYTGVLNLMPDVEVFLEALHELFARRPEARRRVRAKLAGAYDSDYADRAIALGLTGIVEFLGPLPHQESRALQRGADLLVAWKPRHAPTMVPGKLYEYLDAGRPVLALFDADDEAAAMVRRAGGTVIPPGDRDAASRAIEDRYLSWREGGTPPATRPEWLEEHTRRHLAGRLATLLEGLVETRG